MFARIAPDQLEQLAELVADRLRCDVALAAGERLVGVREIAGYLGVDVSWVYAHADELGARRLGEGSRPRLRFSVREVEERLTSCHAGRESDEARSGLAEPRRRRRRSKGLGSGVELLPIRGDSTTTRRVR